MREWIVSTLGGGTAALGIIVAVIALAGVLGGAAVSYIIGQQTVYVNSITAERMKWVNLLRANLAQFMATLERIRTNDFFGMHSDDKVAMQDVADILNLQKTLVLQLNPGGLVDGQIIKIVGACVTASHEKDRPNLTPLILTLQEHSQWLLKAEWERIKYEARSPFGKIASHRRAATLNREYRIFYHGPHSGMNLVRRLYRP